MQELWQFFAFERKLSAQMGETISFHPPNPTQMSTGFDSNIGDCPICYQHGKVIPGDNLQSKE